MRAGHVYRQKVLTSRVRCSVAHHVNSCRRAPGGSRVVGGGDPVVTQGASHVLVHFRRGQQTILRAVDYGLKSAVAGLLFGEGDDRIRQSSRKEQEERDTHTYSRD